MAPAFLKVGTGSGSIHYSLLPKRSGARGVILVTEIDADLAAVVGPGVGAVSDLAAVLGPGAAIRRLRTPPGAGAVSRGTGSRLDRAECSRFAVFYRIQAPRRAPEPVHRMGLAGWAGLQSAVCSVPEDSVPFGRGPAGCGAAANDAASRGSARKDQRLLK